MSTKRRLFTEEFKREAVALLQGSGRPLEHVARELGIRPSLLRAWRRRISGGSPDPATRSTGPDAANDRSAEITRLEREVERLRMERDILKRTVSIFSEPPR